jgi:diaminopimelate epimerase
VGCDQLIVIEPPTDRHADVFMRIYNPDGEEAGACGNATRCVAHVVMAERQKDAIVVQTVAGLLDSEKTGTGANGLPIVSVDMGPALPTADPSPGVHTNHMPIGLGPS